jgi:hypothetical protein
MKLSLASSFLFLSAPQAISFQHRSFSSTSRGIVRPTNDNNNDDLCTAAMPSEEESTQARRSFLQTGAATLLGLGLQTKTAFASLLEEFGSDPSKIDQPKKQAREPAKIVAKQESDFEPNLRSNYYYPTNKKRYLPRIKKCNDLIPDAANMIGNGDWEAAADFAEKVAEDTILPMKLYTSSLLGGGTNVKVSFAKDMNKAAADFEKAQKQLVKYIGKKDQEKSSQALEDLSSALLAYRTAGKLLGPDGGGDIPSVDEIRRAACRVQGRTFEEKVKARDARLAAESSSTSS